MNIEKLRNLEPVFGSWFIDGKVAQGKNSNVYRVSRKIDDKVQFAALKTIRFPGNPSDLRRLIDYGHYENSEEYFKTLEETLKENMERMLSLRDNRNIVRFDKYTIVREPESIYVVVLMELLMPLADYLSGKKITNREIAKMGCDLSFALEGFRSLGIMHRQVKPENIFVDSDGNYKLGDFGIDDRGRTGDTISQLSNYFAPEVLNASARDISSDVYSLGIILYKFANHNRLPFLPPFPETISLSDRQIAFEKRMAGEKLPKPDEADLTLSKIILKATAYKNEERYTSPLQLSSDLERYLQGATVEAQKTVKAVPVPPKKNVVTAEERAKEEYQNAFRDDEETEEDDKKKIYTIAGIIAAVAVVLFVICFFVFGGGKEEPATTLPETTTAYEEITTVSETTTEEPTTEETTTEETTTEETTTEETTTQELTTEETTTEETTTEEPTTEEPDTEEPSTAETTTEGSDDQNVVAPSVPTLYTPTDKKEGDEGSEGRIYTELYNTKVVKEIENDQLMRIIISCDNIGDYPEKNGDAYLCEVSDGFTMLKEPVDFACLFDDENPNENLEIIITLDSQVYYNSASEYYIVFEDSSLMSDDHVILPTQIKI